MSSLDYFLQQAVDAVWGVPLVVLIASSAIYFSIISRLQPLCQFKHAIAVLLGKYNQPDDPGEISHFQALSSALSGTIGMGNIAGVAIAISMGGAGAVFWMWLAGLLGMSTKFFTCTLACLYRKPDEEGIPQGGPMYFIELGLGKKFKPLAFMFAACGMIGCLPLFQANQLAGLLQAQLGLERGITGAVLAIVVAMVIFGGIKRIGSFTARLVPIMFFLYVIFSLIVIILHIEKIPMVLMDIVWTAFGGKALAGGAVGLSFKEVLVTGVQRAVFSNEAGVGTEALAHGAAKTKEPVREGLVAMLGPFIDTHIVCTLTALVILCSGVIPADNGVVMTANAFEKNIPVVGGIILLLIFTLFAASTMITYSYYSEKCAWYLFGKCNGSRYVYIYILSIPIASIWTQRTALNIIDLMFAMMVVPTLTASLLLSPRVIEEMKQYFKRYGA